MVEWLAGGAAAASLAIRTILTFRRGDIPTCQTRIAYEGRGIPLWNKRIALHPRYDGTLEVSPMALPDDTTD